VGSLTYAETLQAIKNAPRPLRLRLVHSDTAEEKNSGNCYYKTSMTVPRSFKVWKPRFWVLGGAVARPNVLQLYMDKQSFDKVVVAVFNKQKINHTVKAFKLTSAFHCSSIKVKRYDTGPAVMHFYIKSAKWHFKQVNFASESRQDIEELRTQMLQYCSKG
jgi:hypothetical protein